MRARIIPSDVRLMLWVPAAMGAIMVPVALLAGEGSLSWSFVGLCAAALVCNLALRLFPEDPADTYCRGETLASAALAWVLVVILGAVPFWIVPLLPGFSGMLENTPAIGTFEDPLNGLFEAVSGLTSTGLTMVGSPSELPATLQFWRTFMEWVGGVGIALIMMVLLNPGDDGGDLFDSELNKPFTDNARHTAARIWWIYLVLTAFGIGLFAALGMPLWESVNHGMTAISTGGFSITDNSFRDYGANLQIAAIVLMTLGAISFAAYREALSTRNPLTIFCRGPIIFLLVGLVAVSGLLWLSRLQFQTDTSYLTLLFQAASAFGTAGFTAADLSEWHSAPLAVLIACMVVGGASGATTGGVKTDRVLMICRGIGWRFRRLMRGDDPRQVTIGEKTYDVQQARLLVEGAATLVSLWTFTALVGCLVLAPVVGDKYTFTQVGFEVMSALSSVGLSAGITSSDMPDSGKWTLIVLMWAGRLELIAAFALFWLPFARKPGPEMDRRQKEDA